MDDLARKYVADSCGRALSAILDANDPSVWVIEDLHLELLLDVHAAAPDDVAAFWGTKMAQCVAKTIARGDDGLRVLRFANRAAYLAYFLRELANDSAWSKWYFAEFSGLRSLPPGTAIRETFLREPWQGNAVLLELARSNRLAGVVARMSSTDQELVLASCASGLQYSSAAMKAVLSSALDPSSQRRLNAIEVYVALLQARNDLLPAALAGAAVDIARILGWSRTRDRAATSAWSLQCVPPVDAEPKIRETILRIRAAIEDDSHLRSLLALTVTASARPDSGPESFASPLGAVFLLLPELFHPSPLFELFGGPDDALRRYLLFLTCFSPKLQDAWRDSAIRLTSGLKESPDCSALEAVTLIAGPRLEALALPEDIAFFAARDTELAPGFSPASNLRKQLAVCAAVLIRSFAGRLPALGGSSIEYLWRNVFAGESQIVVCDNSVQVQLASRPLQIVLRMARLQGLKLVVPWLGDMPVTVRFDQP